MLCADPPHVKQLHPIILTTPTQDIKLGQNEETNRGAQY